jgi:two-component system response regulator MprA
MTAMLIGQQTQPAGSPQPLVLVVEEDSRLASFLDRALAAAGYRVERTTDGPQTLAVFDELAPDVVLLDLGLPGTPGGLEVTRQLRGKSDIPILMLSSVDEVEDRVSSLDAGADDFLPKPVALEELLARIRAVRRGRALAMASAEARTRHGTQVYADVRLNLDTRQIVRGQREILLRNKAFELLACFMRHPERVLTRRELLEEVWGYDFLGDSNVIEVTVSHVRQALEADGEPRLIHTVRPVGYILNKRYASG